jgi:hypothetical protein
MEYNLNFVRLQIFSAIALALLLHNRVGSNIISEVQFVAEFLATDPEVTGSIPGTTKNKRKRK